MIKTTSSYYDESKKEYVLEEKMSNSLAGFLKSKSDSDNQDSASPNDHQIETTPQANNPPPKKFQFSNRFLKKQQHKSAPPLQLVEDKSHLSGCQEHDSLQELCCITC